MGSRCFAGSVTPPLPSRSVRVNGTRRRVIGPRKVRFEVSMIPLNTGGSVRRKIVRSCQRHACTYRVAQSNVLSDASDVCVCRTSFGDDNLVVENKRVDHTTKRTHHHDRGWQAMISSYFRRSMPLVSSFRTDEYLRRGGIVLRDGRRRARRAVRAALRSRG